MPLDKPYYRCYRPNIKSSSLEYLRDHRNVSNPYDYTRKIEILYSRLVKIFEYIEPSNENGEVYSIHISSLLLDICTTIEANFKDILKYNNYNKSNNSLNIIDYFLINNSHHLASYEVKIPFWKGSKNIRTPFINWNKKEKYCPLNWYKSYNQVKHNIIDKFNEATLDNLVDSFCALLILTTAQFYDDEILQDPQKLETAPYGCIINDGDFIETIKTPFLIKFPNDWQDDEKYCFDWCTIKNETNAFVKYNYSS
jgi:hypothetical protein